MKLPPRVKLTDFDLAQIRRIARMKTVDTTPEPDVRSRRRGPRRDRRRLFS